MSRTDDEVDRFDWVTLHDGRRAPIDAVLWEARRLRAREIRRMSRSGLRRIKRMLIAVFGPMLGWNRYQLPEELRRVLRSGRGKAAFEIPPSATPAVLNHIRRLGEEDIAALKTDAALGRVAIETAAEAVAETLRERAKPRAA